MAKTGNNNNNNNKSKRNNKDKKAEKKRQKIDGDNTIKTKKKDESKLPVVSVKKSIKHGHVKNQQGLLLKTPTQLHNARKRRAKQKKRLQQQQQQQQQGQQGEPGVGGGIGGGAAAALGVDPSSQYLSNPYGAPIVLSAKRFFATRLPSFKVYQNGPKIGWRTVSKLPVRRITGGGKKSKVVVGMFQPQTHQVSHNQQYYYPAHHPSINATIKTLEASCQEMGIDVYDEHSGKGYLRYVAMNVERSSGKIQLTLIWKDTPYEEEFDLEQPKSKNSKKNKKKRKRTTSSSNNSQEDDDPSGTTTRAARDIAKGQLERLLIHLLKLGTTTTTTTDESFSSSSTTTTKDSAATSSTSGSSSSFRLHSLWVHYNDSWKHSNAIFDIHSTGSESWKHVYGPKTIAEQLLSLQSTTKTNNKHQPRITPTLHFSPNVFRQANLDAFAYIIQSIQSRIQKIRNNNVNNNNNTSLKLNCLELYGGVGTIGLHLLQYIDSLVCSDENPYNQDCFEASKQQLLLEQQQQQQQNGSRSKHHHHQQQQQCGSITYVPKSASDMVQEGHYLQNKQIVIVDPPRKGLDDVVLDSLLVSSSSASGGGSVQLLIYISCGFDAFQRDCQRLTTTTKTTTSSSSSCCWQLEHAEGHILFPGSNAIETLAYFVPAQRR